MAEDIVTNAPAGDAAADTGKPAAAPATTDVKESTTPEEAAQVLKGSGMKVDVSAKAADKPADKVEEATKDEPAAAKADVKPEEPAEEEIADKPAEAKAVAAPAGNKQFSLQVVDANGTEFTIEAGAGLEEILKDFEPKSNGQILQILKDLGNLETEKAAYEADQVKAAEDADKAERVSAIQAGWNEEIKALQADKRLPVTARGQDNARVAEIYKFMAEENNTRIEAGKPTLNSFEDALDKLELRESKAEKIEAGKQERDTARKNGALVGGSSAPATAAAPVYRTGMARNASEAIRALGLLK